MRWAGASQLGIFLCGAREFPTRQRPFSLGFMKPGGAWHFGTARSFGSPGSGGSLGFADPAAGVGYGYVTSQMGTKFTGDPRDVALRDALYAALQSQEFPRG